MPMRARQSRGGGLMPRAFVPGPLICVRCGRPTAPVQLLGGSRRAAATRTSGARLTAVAASPGTYPKGRSPRPGTPVNESEARAANAGLALKARPLPTKKGTRPMPATIAPASRSPRAPAIPDPLPGPHPGAVGLHLAPRPGGLAGPDDLRRGRGGPGSEPAMAGVAPLPLDEIAAEALKVNCGAGNCWAAPGQPCACDRPGGKHLARFARARRRGLISDADMCAVLDAGRCRTACSPRSP